MTTALTILRYGPTLHIDAAYDAYMVDCFGNLVEVDYGSISVFLNDQFNSIPAALEYYGTAPAPLPDLLA